MEICYGPRHETPCPDPKYWREENYYDCVCQDCGCQFEISPTGQVFKWCPLHNSAEDMYEALQKAQEDINWMLNNRQFLNPDVFGYLDSVLAKAKGRE